MSLKECSWYTHVEEIIGLCEKVVLATKELDEAAFGSDLDLYNEILQYIQSVGGAVVKLPKGLFELYPKLDWRGPMAVHHALNRSDNLFEIQRGFVWEMASETLPLLLFVLNKIKKDFDNSLSNVV